MPYIIHAGRDEGIAFHPREFRNEGHGLPLRFLHLNNRYIWGFDGYIPPYLGDCSETCSRPN
jgi:hypothetical protein